MGALGYKGKGMIPFVPKFPARKPDSILEGSTFSIQAALFRLLTHSMNPIHVDP